MGGLAETGLVCRPVPLVLERPRRRAAAGGGYGQCAKLNGTRWILLRRRSGFGNVPAPLAVGDLRPSSLSEAAQVGSERGSGVLRLESGLRVSASLGTVDPRALRRDSGSGDLCCAAAYRGPEEAAVS